MRFVDDPANELGERSHSSLRRGLVKAREVEQVLDQVGEAPSFLGKVSGESLSLARILPDRIVNGFGRRKDAGDGSLHLMRGVRDEVAADLVDPVCVRNVLRHDQDPRVREGSHRYSDDASHRMVDCELERRRFASAGLTQLRRSRMALSRTEQLRGCPVRVDDHAAVDQQNAFIHRAEDLVAKV